MEDEDLMVQYGLVEGEGASLTAMFEADKASAKISASRLFSALSNSTFASFSFFPVNCVASGNLEEVHISLRKKT